MLGGRGTYVEKLLSRVGRPRVKPPNRAGERIVGNTRRGPLGSDN